MTSTSRRAHGRPLCWPPRLACGGRRRPPTVCAGVDSRAGRGRVPPGWPGPGDGDGDELSDLDLAYTSPLLQAATGLSRSSWYETFGSKRGLFDLAARNYLSEVISPLLAPMESAGAGRDELVGYFLAQAAWIGSSPLRIATRGCLMLNTAMELNDLDSEAAGMVRNYQQRVQAAIRHSLCSFLGPSRDLDRTADVLTAGQVGLMITSRLDSVTATGLGETFAAEIKTW
jgi:TetR/AcrR family transcriptional repressor of nem operon